MFPVSDGARSRVNTSAVCPWKLCSSCPLSTSHRAHVPSPLEVRSWHVRHEHTVKRGDARMQTSTNKQPLRCQNPRPHKKKVSAEGKKKFYFAIIIYTKAYDYFSLLSLFFKLSVLYCTSPDLCVLVCMHGGLVPNFVALLHTQRQ